MIKRIDSDIQSFRTINFHQGLNVLIADKAKNATERQSRNAVGKSSLVEIIDFLLGSKADPKKSVVRAKDLENATFEMAFDLFGDDIVVSRSPSKRTEIRVLGDVANWPVETEFDEERGDYKCHVDRWKSLLGAAYFKLPLEDENGPSFRSLIPYFVRRDRDGGFQEATLHSKNHQVGDKRVGLSYLFGLDWKLAQDFETLRKEEKSLQDLRRSARSGLFDAYLRPSSHIRPELAREERKLEQLKHELANFRVVDEYENLSSEANSISRRISTLNREGLVDRKRLSQIEQDLADEEFTDFSEIEQLYKEAEVVIPDLIKNRYDDVVTFHRKVVSNRRQHLTAERTEVQSRINERNQELAVLDDRRSRAMRLINSGGALETYNELQSEASRIEALVEQLRLQLSDALKLEQSTTQLAARRVELTQQLQSDHVERSDIIVSATNRFGDFFEQLRETTANLIIGEHRNGPLFEVECDDQGSRGVRNTLIFAFDLTLSTLWAEQNLGPGFVVHDSHIFADMDERQVAAALQLAKRTSDQYGIQHIVTLNSDTLPTEGFDADFNINDHILPVRLTDQPDGGLFGFRFSYLDENVDDID